MASPSMNLRPKASIYECKVDAYNTNDHPFAKSVREKYKAERTQRVYLGMNFAVIRYVDEDGEQEISSFNLKAADGLGLHSELTLLWQIAGKLKKGEKIYIFTDRQPCSTCSPTLNSHIQGTGGAYVYYINQYRDKASYDSQAAADTIREWWTT